MEDIEACEKAREKIIACCDWADRHGGKKPVSNHKYGIFILNVRSAYYGKGRSKWYSCYGDVLKNRGYMHWLNYLDREQEAREKIIACCDWADEHNGKKPDSNNIEDKQEQTFGRLVTKIGMLLRDKKKIKLKFYPCYVDVINKRGYSHWLKGIEGEAREKIIACCDWADKHNKIRPNSNSRNKVERQFGKFITEIKSIFRNKSDNRSWYQFYEEILKERGYFHWMTGSLEEEAREKIIACCDWADKNGKPRSSSSNAIERQFGKFISEIKSVFRNKSDNRSWYQFYEEILKERGYFHWMTGSLEEEAREKIIACCDWADKNGKKPSSVSENKEEKKHGLLIQKIRSINDGESSQTGLGKSYPFYEKILKERGYYDWLETLKEKRLKKTISLCDWADEHGGIKPKMRSNNGVERMFGQFLSSMKQKKDPIFINIIKERGYLHWLDNLEMKAEEKIIACCDWADKHGGIKPDTRSSDPTERSFGTFIHRITQIIMKNKKSLGNLYSCYMKILKERGYEHWLKCQKIGKKTLMRIGFNKYAAGITCRNVI